MTDSTLLVTVTGPDRPGVSARLLSTLSVFPITIVDLEQVLISDRLVLGAQLAVDTRAAPGVRRRDLFAEIRDALAKVSAELGMDVSVEDGDDATLQTSSDGRLHVTLLASPLRPATLGAITSCIARGGGNIDRIERLASYPVTAVELVVSGGDVERLRGDLSTEAAAQGIDIAVQPSGLHRRAKHLIVMDVDSTLIQGEVIELLAAHAGCADEVARVTEEAMLGEMDFEKSLRQRVALLKGLDASVLDVVSQELLLTPGARTMVRTLKRLGYEFAIVSGGFTQITDTLVDELGIDYCAANMLEIVDGKLTGDIVGPVVDRAGKAAALRQFATQARVPLNQTVAIGDGANDLDMLQAAGLGVAYNAKPVVRAAADTSVSVPYLDTIVFLLGVSREEVEAADREGQLSDG